MNPRPPGCAGKKAHATEEEAEKTLGEIWARCRPGRRLPCRTYQCDHCGQWHLARQPLPTSRLETAA